MRFQSFRVTLFLVFLFVVFEFGAANEGVSFRFFGGLFVLGLHEISSESRSLIFAEFSLRRPGFGMRSARWRRRARRGFFRRSCGLIRSGCGF